MRYQYSEHWTLRAREIARKLGLEHIATERVVVIKSSGSKTRNTVARIHGLGKVMQIAMQQNPLYAIELLSERFDRQSPPEQTKTIIHELLHIPANFGGGFRRHRPYVNSRIVEAAYGKLTESSKNTP